MRLLSHLCPEKRMNKASFLHEFGAVAGKPEELLQFDDV
jgi:hypothetical protein